MTGVPAPCPLCGDVDVGFFCADAARAYLWCRSCDLVLDRKSTRLNSSH